MTTTDDTAATVATAPAAQVPAPAAAPATEAPETPVPTAAAPAAATTGPESSAAETGLPDLRLASDIGAEARTAVDSAAGEAGPETPVARAERHAYEVVAMTAAAMAAAPGAALAPPFAASLAGNAADASEAVLAPLWDSWLECRTVTEGACAALLDEWEADAWEATLRPLLLWRKHGTPSEPVEDRWRQPAYAA